MCALANSFKDALLTQSVSLVYKTHDPEQYSNRQYEYYEAENREFIEQYAKYSSDYVTAEAQGLYPERPYDYTPIHLRFADIIRPSASMSRNFDSYKIIQIVEKKYAYVRKGAKINTMGSTWLVTNPMNLSGGGTAIIQKCDAVWHYLDYYGNICGEPMCIDTLLMRANDADSQRSSMITKGYFNVKMQHNTVTDSLLSSNARIILGHSAYRISGYSDFIQGFTSVEDSINMIEFTIRYEEPNHAIDDMENKVAGGKTFAWDISISGDPTIKAGEEAALTVTSRRTSGEETKVVENTDEHPVFYLWESSDEDIVDVDDFGNITGISEGTATITVKLEQNPNKMQTFEITVAGSTIEPHVAFTNTPRKELKMYSEMSLNAVYYENGEATSETVTWTATGADEECYTLTTSGNTATVKCWRGSVTPLTITATYEDYSVSTSVELEGL